MTIRIQTLIAEVESLPEADLADMIEAFLASRDETVFTPEELEHIDRLAAQPFVPADPDEVAAFFAGRG